MNMLLTHTPEQTESTAVAGNSNNRMLVTVVNLCALVADRKQPKFGLS